MASHLGNFGLRSTLSHWWESRRGDAAAEVDDAAANVQTFVVVDPEDGQAELSRVLENLVIPKLIANCGTLAAPGASLNGASARKRQPAIIADDILAFTGLSIHEDAHAMLVFAERFLNSGHSVENLYIDLLAPAARKLGEYWEADSEDFVTVTMALWRIQEVLRELTLRVPPAGRTGAGQRSALFSALPGEQHSFGTLMVADCFERAGWLTDVLIEPDRPELTGKFASQHYDLIGLTVSCDCSSAALAALVTTIRTVSRNPHVKVLLGGRAINLDPDLVAQSGADGTAIDASAAVKLAETLVPVTWGALNISG